MRRISMCFFGLIFLVSMEAEKWKTGLNLGTESIELAVGVEFFDCLQLSLEGGTSWERESDMRIDDAKFGTVLRYVPPLFNSFSPYILTGFQYRHINTGYTSFWTPGIEVGLGLLIPIGARNEILLEGGWQYATKMITSRKPIGPGEVIYEETWRSPALYLNLGWRLNFWSRGS